MATGSEVRTGRHVVCAVADLPPGGVRIAEVAGRSIGVFNVEGDLYALRNVCPHHGAPLCAGRVTGTMRSPAPEQYRYDDGVPDRVLRCPWHGYEFRLEDGRSLTAPDRLRARTYEVAAEDGEVVVYA